MNTSSASHEDKAAQAFDDYRRELDEANQELQSEISERQRAEAAMRAYAQRLDHQHASQVAILSARSLADTLEVSVRHIKNSLSCLSMTIFVYDFDRSEVEILQSDHPDLEPGRRAPIRFWPSVEALRRGEHYIVDEIAHLLPEYPEVRVTVDMGGHTLLMVPLQYRDKLIGALSIITDHPHTFTADELAMSREIASTLAIAIQYRRWLAAEQSAREREATMRHVAENLTSDLDLDSVLREILSQLQKLVPTASSTIFLREGDQMRVAASRAVGSAPDLMERFAANFPDYMKRMMATGTPVIISDTTRHPDWVWIEGGDYVNSWMGIPLTAKGESLGMLTLDRERPNDFSQEDLATASTLAAHAAIGIHNARLYAAEQAYASRMAQTATVRTRELQALYEISAGSDNLELGQRLALSLRMALEAIDYSAGMIHLADANSGSLVMAAHQGLPREVLNMLDPHTPQGRVFHERLAATDALWSNSRSSRTGIRLCNGYESYIVAPLRAQGQVLGAMTLLSIDDRTLPPESLRLLSAIADQIGLAVESADLRRQARQTAVLAERERIAADLHDMVTQSLYSLILLSEAARETGVQGNIEEMQKCLHSLMDTARRALGEMRTLLYDLRSDALAGMGLAAALAFRLGTVEQRSGLKTELLIQNADNLPAAVEDVLYRVALESLNNTLRHANARTVEVMISLAEGSVVLTIDDDGAGFDMDAVAENPGMGMRNMHGRIRDAGGTLLVQSAPGQGTRIEARIPTGQPAIARGPNREARKEAYNVEHSHSGS